MEHNQSYLVVDAGNTQIKLVYFQQGEIQKVFRINIDDTSSVKKILVDHPYQKAILSSVQSIEATRTLKELIHPYVVLDQNTPLPIDLSNYKTIATLGTDRIANVVAAKELSKSTNALVVDIGTCIKYDLVSEGAYRGGGIAPGLEMRFKALHDYTGRLPLLAPQGDVKLIGDSTESSMQSGVLNGMIAELEGIITQYTQQFQPLTIFLTGGDAKRFDKALKNSIFAEENLTVIGLYLILQHNG